MVSDLINHGNGIKNAAASAPRDFRKKKRANRSAKLKQSKLDARREQWLSQGAVVKNKEGKEEVADVLPTTPANDCQKGMKVHPLERLEMRRKGKRGKDGVEEVEHDNCSYSDSSFNSPTGSSILGRTDYGTNYGGSSSSSSSSGRSGCFSGSITEEEEGGGGEDDDCLDDWEAVADALAAADGNPKQRDQDSHLGLEVELGSTHEHGQNVKNLSSLHESFKQDCERALPPSLAPTNSRAWRPDDVFRPQSLPTLTKQLSLTIGDRNYARVGAAPWTRCVTNVPSSCPICCEEFDCTDTSFLPCLCGFRLCLFCHKRILEEDGRCPGCRKPYKPLDAQSNGHGGDLTLRLARSSTMNVRSQG